MLCFVPVGENTFPNIVPLLTSLSAEELSFCSASRWIPLDECPFIWKNFSQHNYLTGHFEDSPKINAFNYLKAGFIRSPVDIYLRPWMLAAYRDVNLTFYDKNTTIN